MNKFTFTVLFMVLLFLSGCAAQHTLENQSLSSAIRCSEDIYVSIKGSDEPSYIRNTIRSSGIFDRVLKGEAPGGKYQVTVNMDQATDDGNTGMLFLRLFTFFLAPYPMTVTTEMDFVVSMDGVSYGTYSYSDLARKNSWLFDAGGEVSDDSIRNIINSFLKDAVHDGVFDRSKHLALK